MNTATCIPYRHLELKMFDLEKSLKNQVIAKHASQATVPHDRLYMTWLNKNGKRFMTVTQITPTST